MSTIQDTVYLTYKLSEKLKSANIDIWLTYGSSLGAVREGQIIEGDDDIDLMMWHEDLEKFKKIICEGGAGLPRFRYNFREFAVSKGHMCKITLGDKTLPMGQRIPWDSTKTHCVSCGEVVSNSRLCQPCTEYGNQFHIDIYFLKKSPDGVRCYDTCFPETSFKLYHYENLRKIKFENLDLYVSKYAEKTLDFFYNGIDGTNNTWRTPISSDNYNYECAIKEEGVQDEDIFTGYVEGVFDLFHVGHLRMLERSSKIFDKVVAGVHSDETVIQYKEKKPVIPYEHRVEILRSCKFVDDVIEAPLLGVNGVDGVDFLNKNNLDYLIHGKTKSNLLKEQFSEIAKENRLLLLDETEDYHTTDIIKDISTEPFKPNPAKKAARPKGDPAYAGHCC